MNKITLFLSFVLVLGFSQCRKPVLLDFGGGQTQPITFTTAEGASRGDFMQDDGNLKFQWTLGGETEPKDKIYVYASYDGTFDADHSEYCGCLGVKNIETTSAGVSVATFEGYAAMSSDLYGKMKENTSKMRFIHYGKNVSVTTSGDDEGVASVSFAQQCGKLTDSDCSSGEVSVSSMTVAMLDMDYKPSGKYSGGAMKILFAIARFSFEKFTSATTVLLGDDLKTGINVSKNGKIEYSKTATAMVLNGVSPSYYVVLVPEKTYADGEDIQATECTFRGGGWTASGPIKIKPGVFFSGSESGVAININPVDVIPEGGLNGRFSVADGKQVYFSKGNLQFLPWGLPAGQSFNPKFRFAENQWDYLGENSSSAGVVLENYQRYNCESESAARDLFGWGTAKLEGNTSVPWALSTYDSYYGPASENLNDGSASGTNYETYDWGHLMSPSNTWRTMSNTEFWYLYDTRNNNASFNSTGKFLSGHGTLTLPGGGTRYGLFILPDDYYRTADGRPVHTQRRDDTWSYTTAQLVAYNIVFLPQGGYRDNTTLDRIGLAGHYWTSTHVDGTNAYVIDYNSDNGVNAQKEHSFLRHYGCCVRLVANVENNSIGTATPFGSGNW
ncbi:MAG: hypothetical protein Q4F69_10790 [Bacteroidia bacterium]|nr:hypothetical protein [Bacteroidia bacterium]